jgi:hypothetical protein
VLHAVAEVDGSVASVIKSDDEIRSLVLRCLSQLATVSSQVKTCNDNQLLLFGNVKLVHGDILATGLVKSPATLSEPIPIDDVIIDDPDYYDTAWPESMKMDYPLKTLDELKDFESRLEQKENADSMAKCLANNYCGKGGSWEDCATAIYHCLFDTTLNWVMCFEGTKAYQLEKWDETQRKEKGRESFKELDAEKRIRQVFTAALKRGSGKKEWNPTKATDAVEKSISKILRKSSTGDKATKERKARERKKRQKEKEKRLAEGVECENEGMDGASSSGKVGERGRGRKRVTGQSEKNQKNGKRGKPSGEVESENVFRDHSDENAQPTVSVASNPNLNAHLLSGMGPAPPTAVLAQTQTRQLTSTETGSSHEALPQPVQSSTQVLGNNQDLVNQLLNALRSQLPVGGQSHPLQMHSQYSSAMGHLLTSSQNVLNDVGGNQYHQ